MRLRCRPRLPFVLVGAAIALSACTTNQPPLTKTEGLPEAHIWQDVRIPAKRPTHYTPDTKDGVRAWRALADRSASLWKRTVRVEPFRLGAVEFSWWVSSLIPGADITQVEASDSPARVVFAFEGDVSKLTSRNRMLFDLTQALTGEAPPYATLMYVWANQVPEGSVVLSGRTDRVRKIVVESGAGHLGQWRHYQRDLAADFRRAFGEDPGALIGIALMTDADNTGSYAEAWYGNITVGDAAGWRTTDRLTRSNVLRETNRALPRDPE